ncbi:electron transfer flavoprotein domain-containing protein [Dipodascopsis tothii]|uniref:electron transfer flavoprotein domain-containing protein n=1 Tax=Dipodascopsis tothii TaxID=44089 RepID=UPI0034CDDBE4
MQSLLRPIRAQMPRACRVAQLAHQARQARLASSLAVLDTQQSSLNIISAAQSLGEPITVLVTGSKSQALAETASKLTGVTKVLQASSAAYDHGLAENIAPLIVANVQKHGFSHVFAATSAFGKSVLPRAAALLDVQQISDVTAVQSEDTFVRPIYAGNVIATVRSSDPVKLVTVRASAFAVPAAGTDAAPIEAAEDPAAASSTEFVSQALAESERPELGSARNVVSGGRGLASKEQFDAVMYPLADALDAAVGASRAAVDSGFADNSLQVGQTGKVVAPDLYVAVGISGAIQHLAGMKDSKTIVAINKDPDAPIFQVADIGLEADLFEAVPELTAQLKK